jgi:hypothetical protein
MSKDVRYMAELNGYLIIIMQDVIEEVLEKINEKLKEHVQTDVYDMGDNVKYAAGFGSPTGDLKESVTSSDVKVNGNSVSGEVYHDTNTMSLSIDNFIHGSKYWDTTDMREYLPDIIENGLSGTLFESGAWYQEPRPYFSNTLKELESSGLIKQWFKSALQSRGMRVM